MTLAVPDPEPAAPSRASSFPYLRSLPDLIAAHEEDGQPVIVEFPPTLSPTHQALLASLGVLVRFTNNEERRDGGHR